MRPQRSKHERSKHEPEVEAARKTPEIEEEGSRKERTRRLPMSTYICSDIHGQYDLYKSMLQAIDFSESDQLYILGDMIDRGPDGLQILQDAASRPNVTCLIGNHEYMMWNYICRPLFLKDLNWLNPSNGGTQTLSAYKKLTAAEKSAVKKYLSQLYLQVEITVEGTTFLLSHSSFLPAHNTVRWRDQGISKNDVSYVVWNSPWRAFEHTDRQEYRSDGRYHIIGHVPVLMIDNSYWQNGCMTQMPAFYHDPENRIVNIDLGCALIPRISANPDRFEEAFKKVPSLCVLNLDQFAKGEECPALYIRGWDFDTNNS